MSHGHRNRNKKSRRNHRRYRRCDDYSCDEHSCEKPLKSDTRVKLSELSVAELKALDAILCDLTVKDTLNSRTANLETANIKQLNIGNIDINRSLALAGAANFNSRFDEPIDIEAQDFRPKKPDNINQRVFDALFEELSDLSHVQARLTEQRTRLGLPTEGREVQLVGTITLPPQYRVLPDDPARKDEIRKLTKIVWNLQCANPGTSEVVLENNPDNDDKVIGVILKYAWLEDGEVKIVTAAEQSSQFRPTIDFDPAESVANNDLFITGQAEKFHGNQPLDTRAIELLIEKMPDPEDTAAIQLIVVRERGLRVYFFEDGVDDELRQINSNVINPNCLSNCSSTVGDQGGNVTTSVSGL